MSKYCSKCGNYIDEDNEKYGIIMTKKGKKIIDFDVFHFNCWKEFFKMNVDMEVERVLNNRKL